MRYALSSYREHYKKVISTWHVSLQTMQLLASIPGGCTPRCKCGKNNFLNLQQWGWKTTKHDLLPNATEQPAAPQDLLNKISCTCGKGYPMRRKSASTKTD
ncbi:hypothetical protein PR048_019832 [Dryococelus australis]|uniref:Uncharacterized protein n=1 Tax=Dryococelus australis TaxID=614101 RepID=A0ABQ9H4K7_9NEOP|nr:hypothetical protein PR048_019832 [Dryococelus australis]